MCRLPEGCTPEKTRCFIRELLMVAYTRRGTRAAEHRKAGLWRGWLGAGGRPPRPDAVCLAWRTGGSRNREGKERFTAGASNGDPSGLRAARCGAVRVLPALRRMPLPARRLRIPARSEAVDSARGFAAGRQDRV